MLIFNILSFNRLIITPFFKSVYKPKILTFIIMGKISFMFFSLLFLACSVFAKPITTNESTSLTNTAPMTLEIISFSLVDADTDQVLLTFTSPTFILDRANFPNLLNFCIRANASLDVQSVNMFVSGAASSSRTENVLPFALFGNGANNPQDYLGNPLNLGIYNISAVPFSEKRAEGTQGPGLLFQLTVIDSNLDLTINSFTMVNSDNDTFVDLNLFTIGSPNFINIGNLTFDNFSIQVNTSSEVESVRLELSGPINSTRVESVLPYALFGDGNSNPVDFFGEPLTLGSYTLIVTPFSDNQAMGSQGAPVTLKFTFFEITPGSTPNQSNLQTSNGITKVYPNPVQNQVNLEFDNKVTGQSAYRLLDFQGNLVETGTLSVDNRQAVMDLAYLKPGSYILEVDGEIYHLLK